jgi:hypothetical protein
MRELSEKNVDRDATFLVFSFRGARRSGFELTALISKTFESES